jgi:hypothetical protein
VIFGLVNIVLDKISTYIGYATVWSDHVVSKTSLPDVWEELMMDNPVSRKIPNFKCTDPNKSSES